MKRYKRLIMLIVLSCCVTAHARTEADYPSLIYDIYVDATTGNTWPTDAANYTLLSDWSYGASESTSVVTNEWYRKEGSSAALYGTAFQGVGTELPQLTMNSGDVLDPAKTYNVYAVCWCREGDEYWYTYTGLDGGPLWLCDCDENDNMFSTGEFVINGCQLFLGQVTGVSSVLVNMDGPDTDDIGHRAWFDGLAFVETTPGPFVTLDIAGSLTDPASVAQNALDGNVINVSPAAGSNSIAQGTRVRVSTDEVAANCPDIYDFTGFSGDVTDSSNTIDLKMDQNVSLTVNYEVRVYTPECGDLCHPEFQGDTNDDCEVDIEDFVNIAKNWLRCTKPECD